MADTNPTISDVLAAITKTRTDIMARIDRLQNEVTALGRDLDTTQTDVRSVKAEQPAMRTYIGARASETEALITRLFDRLNDRLDQSERSIEERLRKLEGEGG
jgi:chromosome segregation ATPase